VAWDSEASFGSRLVTGAFGALQAAAAEHATTSGAWEALRRTVGQWQWTASGEGGSPSVGELEARGKAILSEQGVGIQQMNEARRTAGEWLGARERLESLGPEGQIGAQHVFRPPWAETTGTGTPEQYRARVQWQLTTTSGETSTKWSTYELTSPLSSTSDLESQVTSAMEDDRYLLLLSGGAPPLIESLEVEQI
jgi:hypothetical protein